MKRKIVSFISILATVILCAFCLSSCGGSDAVKAKVVESNQTLLVIEIEDTDGKATLRNAMDALKKEKEISFEADSTGMIISINGQANGGNSYWMLYTSDKETSDPNFTYTYGDRTFDFALLGAQTLIVAKGATYVWTYQTF